MTRDEQIWSLRAKGHRLEEIAAAVGCSPSTASRIVQRELRRRSHEAPPTKTKPINLFPNRLVEPSLR